MPHLSSEEWLQAVSVPASASTAHHGRLLLTKFGLFLVPSVVSRAVTASLAASFDGHIAATEAANRAWSFEKIHEWNNSRREFVLPYDRATTFLSDCLGKVADGIDAYLNGEETADRCSAGLVLAELSTITSSRGGRTQLWHADHPVKGKYVTCQLYLEDTTRDMGPLEVAPVSHRWSSDLKAQALVRLKADDPAATRGAEDVSIPQTAMEVDAGTLVCYDAALLHRGLGSTSERRRHVAYFTVISRGTPVLDGETIVRAHPSIRNR